MTAGSTLDLKPFLCTYSEGVSVCQFMESNPFILFLVQQCHCRLQRLGVPCVQRQQ